MAKRFKAPKGKFRVVTVDLYEMTESGDCIYPLGDFATKEEAMRRALREIFSSRCERGVYDDKGRIVFSTTGKSIEALRAFRGRLRLKLGK